MKRTVCSIFALVQIFILCACGTNVNDKDNSSDKSESVTSESSKLEDSEENIEEAVSLKPDKSTCEAMKKIALSGMTEENVETLTTTIKKRNEYLEKQLTYENYELKLTDPNSL